MAAHHLQAGAPRGRSVLLVALVLASAALLLDPAAPAGILVLGLTGEGKSTLCNTLVGDAAGTRFHESAEMESDTGLTSGMAGSFCGAPTFIVDTPGLLDPRGGDNEHLADMVQYVAGHKDLRALVVAINAHSNRLSMAVKRVFQVLANIYMNQPWYEHLAVVWTHYPGDFSEDERQAAQDRRRDGFRRFMQDFIELSEAQAASIPQHFVDSRRARDGCDTQSALALSELVRWAGSLETLHAALGEPRQVRGDVKAVRVETEEAPRVVSSRTECGTRTEFLALHRRTVTEMYEGGSYEGAWEEVPGSRSSRSVQLPVVRNEAFEEKRKRSEFDHTDRQSAHNGYYIVGYNADIDEERTCWKMSNCTIECEEWHEVSRSLKEVSRDYVKIEESDGIEGFLGMLVVMATFFTVLG